MKIVNVVGGLGSQMMAYSLHMALKEFYPDELVICDFTAYQKYQRIDHNGSELKRAFGIHEDCLPSLLAPIIHSRGILPRIIRKVLVRSGAIRYHDAMEKRYNYDESVFKNNGSVIYLQCWTSWKYFENVEDRVRDTFSFVPLKDLRNIEMQALIQSENSVSVHVRRGDYLESGIHGGLVDIKYYSEAVDVILQRTTNPHFFIFSDDPEWVKENLEKIIEAPVTIIDWNKGRDSFIDMQLMSSCHHHIIPNSSFSWWGAYLSPYKGKIVIAPKYWSHYSSGIELKDMNMPGWIEINNITSP